VDPKPKSVLLVEDDPDVRDALSDFLSHAGLEVRTADHGWDALRKLALAGVGTIVGMHMGEEHRKVAKEEKMNVVIAGHVSSDSLGMNLIIDQYERQGVAVIACSGFTRVSRA
jgi:DNA-binding NtrC family response regulator